jgi:uncharacterized membrane protein YfcA
MTLLQGALIVGSGVIAGAMNAVAGGGTLLSFPTLIWTGLAPINANATNTVALVPGALAGAWGYRREMQSTEPRRYLLLIPSFIGGLIGGILLRYTPPATFAAIVPWLILFAVILFALQEPIQKKLRGAPAVTEPQTTAQTTGRWLWGAAGLQLLTGIYGGYFGAGMGIMMLATLSLLGFANIHQMNGLKNLLGMTINLIAALYFIVVGLVHWPEALVMAVGAIAGGYGGAGLARKLGPKFVRAAVIVIGIGMALSLLLK